MPTVADPGFWPRVRSQDSSEEDILKLPAGLAIRLLAQQCCSRCVLLLAGAGSSDEALRQVGIILVTGTGVGFAEVILVVEVHAVGK